MTVPKGMRPQLFFERTIGDAIESIPDLVEALRGIRLTRNARTLSDREIKVAKSVFKNTIPYSRVVVTDGVGVSGRPFTIPVPGTSPRKYAIYVGLRGYTGMSYLQSDKELLIHELTHVWQGVQATWAWSVQGSSLYHQIRQGEHAYDYDHSKYGEWSDYNPEQQASIVEHWFRAVSLGDNKDDLNETLDDPRYPFIVLNIRGEAAMPLYLKSHQETTMRFSSSQKDTRAPISDYYLINILKVRYAETDVAGYGGRIRELESVFGNLKSFEAVPLNIRLILKRPGDQVASYFHGHLSKASRDKLMGILKTRLTAI